MSLVFFSNWFGKSGFGRKFNPESIIPFFWTRQGRPEASAASGPTLQFQFEFNKSL